MLEKTRRRLTRAAVVRAAARSRGCDRRRRKSTCARYTQTHINNPAQAQAKSQDAQCRQTAFSNRGNEQECSIRTVGHCFNRALLYANL